MFFIFVGMESLLYWHEKLDALEKGASLPVPEDNVAGVYSAIRTHFPPLTCEKQFTIRTDKVTRDKHVFRTK